MPRPLILTAPEPEEHEIQIACTKLLRVALLPDVQWTAIDHAHSLDPTPGRNGRPIGLAQAAKRKARGVKAGICDYLFWHRGLGFAIELKTVDGVLSDSQRDFIRGLLAARVPVKVCWTIDQLLATVDRWELIRPGVKIAA